MLFHNPNETPIPEELQKLWAERDIAQVVLDNLDPIPVLEELDNPEPLVVLEQLPVPSEDIPPILPSPLTASAPLDSASTIKIYSTLSLFPTPLDISKFNGRSN
jgi:hypothetical protein